MPEFVRNIFAWMRHKFGFSTSRESWTERAGDLLLLTLIGCLIWAAGGLSLPKQLILWTVFLLVLGLLLAVGWVKLFGPVLVYDLIRTARRTRYILIRTVYCCFFLGLLWWIYYLHLDQFRRQTGGVTATQMADFSETFFFTFMIVQFLLVVLLTPAYTGSAIAEEKERKTLEFLLATDLRNREIVLDKFLSRLANILLLGLAGLPILSILQFLGGIDPGLLLAGYAATALTVLSLGSLSMLSSVQHKDTRSAIIFTYVIALAYFAVSLLGLYVKFGKTSWALFDLSFGAGWLTVTDLIDALAAGNPLFQFVTLANSGRGGRGASMNALLPGILQSYATFHLLVAAICIIVAIVRVRALGLKQKEAKARKSGFGRKRFRPAVFDRPMIWKEVFAESGFRGNWMGRVFLALLVLSSFFPLLYMFYEYVIEGIRNTSWQQTVNAWVRVIGSAVACLSLVSVAVRASGSIILERDRQTFDSLLTSPLDSDAILFGKWLGSILSVRLLWIWLALMWGSGVIAGAVHPFAVPLLVGAWLVYATFLASLGCWFSMVSRTALRANVNTVLTAAGVAFGHWLVWLCCMPLMIGSGPGGAPGEFLDRVALFQAFGLTPPITLGFLPFHAENFEVNRWNQRNMGLEMLTCALIGLCLYGAASGFLWSLCSHRFRVLTGRTPYHGPDRPKGVRPAEPFAAAAAPEALLDHKSAIPEVLPADGDSSANSS